MVAGAQSESEATSRVVPGVCWVAGETSGDLLAAPVMHSVHELLGEVQAFGVGGSAMQSQGLEALWDISALSVRGYAEVISALPRLLAMRRALRNKIIARRPDVFVGVDAPDFNFKLEQQLRTAGIRTVHFIGPSVWAWRRERLNKIVHAVDHMLLVFPFEKAIYDQAGIAATYVGHPMADEIDPSRIHVGGARAALGLARDPAASGGKAVVALLPGSRSAEIKYMGQLFIQTAVWLHSQRNDLQFVMPAATPELAQALRDIAASCDLPGDFELTIVEGRARLALAAADTVLVASGTATLETALMQRPMVIAYRMARSSYQIMRRMGYLPYVGLPNILCDDWVVPEYIQDDATAPALGAALLEQLDNAPARDAITARFAQLHGQLAINCARRAAQVICDHVAN